MNTGADGIRLIKCIDDCLTGDGEQRLHGLSALANHPDARASRVVAFLSRRLLFDDDRAVAREATRILAFRVGRCRWSGGANTNEEKQLIDDAVSHCRDFTPSALLAKLRWSGTNWRQRRANRFIAAESLPVTRRSHLLMLKMGERDRMSSSSRALLVRCVIEVSRT